MLVGLALVSITGATWIDPVVALLIAVAIVYTGLKVVAGSWRVLVDEALPDDETAAIRDAIESFGERGVAGYHELRTRRAGSRRYVDVHVQFRSGTTLEDAHAIAHELQDTIRDRLRGADVLIHLEPEDRVRPGEEIGARAAEGSGNGSLRGGSDAPSATSVVSTTVTGWFQPDSSCRRRPEPDLYPAAVDVRANAHRRLIAAEIATASSTPAYPR